MKTRFVCFALLLTSATMAQTKVVFDEDTVAYKGQKFFAGKEYWTASGSGSDKTFQWVFVSDSAYRNVKPLYPVYAKTKFVVEKVYNTHRGWSVQSRLPDITRKDGKVIPGELVFFVVEKAVDNKEVVIE